MTFQAPWWLLGLLAVVALVALYVVLQLRRKAYAARFTNVALLGTLVPKRPGWRRHLSFGLVALALAALIVSLAVPSTEVRVPRERATVIMAVDVSLSMQATDIEPSRFEAMQVAAKEFVDVLPERINLGLVSFAGTATTVVTPTTDRGQVRTAIDNLELAESTAIGEAVFTSLTAIENFQSSLDADGDVVDIALNTVKVQNWDKTITTIPTYRLISESFKNWRGMSDAGGRRIKRALLIDQASVRFLDKEERDRLRRIALIDAYLDGKRAELEAYNATLEAAGKDPVNTRRVTNLGTFRAYVTEYLRAHPRVHQGMTLMVRQLEPGPTGLPLEVYCFSANVAWAAYENLAADIFDHLLAMLPEFDLRIYQQPAGADVAMGIRALAARAATGDGPAGDAAAARG